MLNLLSNNKKTTAFLFIVAFLLLIPASYSLAAPTVGKEGGWTGNGGDGTNGDRGGNGGTFGGKGGDSGNGGNGGSGKSATY